MKKSLLVLGCLVGWVIAAHAQSVSINIDAGQLFNTTGTTAEPVGGLLQLIASPSGTFAAPTSSSYTSGDNVLVASFAMNTNGGANEVFFALSAIPLTSNTTTTVGNGTLAYTLSPYALVAGEKLTLRFYPSLTYAAKPSTPPLATTYGQVRSDSIEFGAGGGVPNETAWIVPAAGATVNFEYVTVSGGGTYANNTAFATNVVLVGVPEPSTYALFAAGFGGLVGLRSWNRRRAA